MIDVTHEELMSLSQAAAVLPRRRRGRKPHVSCLYRWTTIGCRGVLLESVQVGATRCTSREAIARFVAELTTQYGPAQPHSLRTPTARRRAVERAEQELAELGV